MKQQSSSIRERIIRTKEILGGRPRIKGYRIGVEHVMSYIDGGASVEEVMKHYPDLGREDILACIDYAKHEKGKRKRAKRRVA